MGSPHLSEVAALDLGHKVTDRIRKPESGAIVAVGEAGQGDRNGRIADLAQPPGDRLPGPASLPGSRDKDEGGGRREGHGGRASRWRKMVWAVAPGRGKRRGTSRDGSAADRGG